MNSFKEMKEICDILSKYNDKDFAFGAEHDVIYFYGIEDLSAICEEDGKRLEELGVGINTYTDEIFMFV